MAKATDEVGTSTHVDLVVVEPFARDPRAELQTVPMVAEDELDLDALGRCVEVLDRHERGHSTRAGKRSVRSDSSFRTSIDDAVDLASTCAGARLSSEAARTPRHACGIYVRPA
jgi:hypothetical protein